MNFLSIFSLILMLYLSVSLLWWMPVSRFKKFLLFLFFLLISQKYTFYQLLGTGPFNPSLPLLTTIIAETLYNIFLILISLLVIKDVLWWLLKGLEKLGVVIPRPMSSLQMKAFLIATSMILGPWGVYSALKVPEVKTIEVRIQNLDSALDGYRIVQLTDLHVGQMLKRPWLASVVEKTNALDPDLVVMTGDLIEGSVKKLSSEVEPFARLRARDGVFAVTGNHEHYHGANDWERYFELMGIVMLENKHRMIQKGDAQLLIAGITDRAALRFGKIGPNLEMALNGAQNAPVVLLSHQPKEIDTITGVDLQLSGHTHGGLIKWIQPLVAFFNGGYVEGLYRISERTQLYVHPGTGLWTGMACRVGVPSEITQIVLRSSR